MSDEPIRDDHAELLRRRALTEDAARPDAVERRHAANGRTARENIDDLVDPGTFVEYGRFAIAAQRFRRDLDDLIARTPADGLVAGTARINGDLFGDERSASAVLSYDYTVLAGTQGYLGHRKKDRLFELIERMRLPTVFFAEGGGGRPGDTDFPTVSSLETRAFKLWAQLSGVVPRIAIVKGRCFAGNAVIAGSSDLIVATKDASIGMGGPAMIAGGGLGDVHPDEVGPISVQEPNGVVDVVVADEAEAVAVTKRLLGYFQGSDGTGCRARPNRLAHNHSRARPTRLRRRPGHRDVGRRGFGDVPAAAFRPRDGHRARPDRGPARRGRRQRHAVHGRRDHRRGVRQGGPLPAAVRLLRDSRRVADRLPGLHGRPGRRGRSVWCGAHPACSSRAPRCACPLVAVVLRRGYGLGAQAMTGGSLHEPLLTVAWPGAHLGPMGLEGAVRLGLRKELEAIADDDEREERVRQATAAAQENAKALNAAQLFEIDDVIDPADTRRIIADTLTAATAHAEPVRRAVSSTPGESVDR